MTGHEQPAAHRCEPPKLPHNLTAMTRPDWTCGVCGRVWRHVNDLISWWAEIRGPSHG